MPEMMSLVSFLHGVIVRHKFSFHDGNLPVLLLGARARLQLLPDHHHLAAVVELLHEVPGLQPRHARDVHVIHKKNLVTHFQNAVLICCATYS